MKILLDAGIVIALIFGCASIGSSICFGLVPSIRKRKLENLQIKVSKMAKDINFFYYMEELLLSELSALRNESGESLKRQYRKQIENKIDYKLSDYAKPSVTKKEIQNNG